MKILVRTDNQNDRHVHCTVFAGPEAGTLASCGHLTMTPEEYKAFTTLLVHGNINLPHHGVVISTPPIQPNKKPRNPVEFENTELGDEG